MKLNRLLQMATALVAVFAFVGCDEDYTDIGGEIINNPTDVELTEVEVNAYSQKINSIQTNNLNNYFLGVNQHPIYGSNTASIVTQLVLSQADPDFGDNPVLDSVVMTIPYFSTEIESTSEEGEIEYKLDSVFGEGSFRLSIYETGFFLNTLDPDSNFENAQRYYSDQQPQIEQNILGSPIFVNENFKASAARYVNFEPGDGEVNDTVAYEPAFRLKLPTDYFQQKIIDQQGTDVLLNNGNFTQYLRSFFIKAEQNSTEGQQILLDYANENSMISLYYTYEEERENDEGNMETVSLRGKYDLNLFNANRFNTYTGEFPGDLLAEIEDQDPGSGSENLYLKSQEGSMVIVDIFPDETVLEQLRGNNWLINEANLTFYVARDELNGAEEPERLYLYNVENNTVIADYQLDPSLNESDPSQSKTTFSVPLERDEDENGILYKLRVTSHVASILRGDTENVKLGVVIPGNINTPNFSAVRGIEEVERVPLSTLSIPYGTVLHGDESADEEKRLKLRIYYTDY
ncbi:DUF4270 domain-containing protein [Gramella sp. GC03-9]|uniref:DUF4270 domain-containing protein n=1 Tax=Christiangramia oceanisediminis TaxID=2920386 RepID=A0A9X2I772_9FLAO|nr:DUF4270 domain-containing protein [Gramella oceanisediminis]MCP9198954.1 DUF4270 domain-containing protein [Gramella oceanisediminis]